MKRVWWSVLAAMVLCVGGTALAQSTDTCSENRGAVRSGSDGTAPAYDPTAPNVQTISFDDFEATTYATAHPTGDDPANLQSTRISPEETTIYQIDGLELHATTVCEGAMRLEFGKLGSTANSATIFAFAPGDACVTGSPYQQATTSAVDTFLEKYSSRALGDKDACFSAADSEKNSRLLRVTGVGYWTTDLPPQLVISPVLSIVELDDEGNPIGGGGNISSLPFQVAFPSEMGSDPVVIANAASQQIAFSTVAQPTFSNDLHLSATSNASEADDFHVSVTPELIAAPGVGEAKVNILTTANTRPGQYIVTVAATSYDAAGTATTTSNSFIVDLQCTPPFILATDQPAAVSAPAGSATSVSVHASGSGPFRYQWYRGFRGMTFSPVEGGTGSTLTVPVAGTESYWVRISNACGTVDSNPTTVTAQ